MRIGMIAPPWIPVPPPDYGGTEVVIERVHVLDTLLDPAFFGRLPGRELLSARLAASLAEAT